MKKSVLTAAGIIVMGLSFIVMDASAATKMCEKDGYYVKGSSKSDTCEACPAGYYCPDKKNKKKCPAGSYCPGLGGVIGKGGAIIGVADGKIVGYEESYSGGVIPIPCEGNTYSAAGQSKCSGKCDGEKQIVNSKHTGCVTCSPKQKPNEDHTACENRCNPGEYAKGTGKNKTCPSCGAGYYCPDGKNRTRCPAGSYCPANAIQAIACTGDTYSTAGQSSCKTCPKGKKPNANHTKCVKA